LYYGTVSTPQGVGNHLSGALRRIVTDDNANPSSTNPWNFSTLIDLSQNPTGLNYQPISSAPNASFDENHNLFVYFGTGRYLTTDDKANNDQQAFYGIKEPREKDGSGNLSFTWLPVAYNTLYNSTNVSLQTATDGGVSVTGGVGTDTNTSWQDFLAYMDGNYSGWTYKLRLTVDGISGNTAERAVNQPAVTDKLFLGTSFVPTTDICDNLGHSYLYALNYRTGAGTTNVIELGSGLATGITAVGNNVYISYGGGLLSYKTTDLQGALNAFDPDTGGTPGQANTSHRVKWREIDDPNN